MSSDKSQQNIVAVTVPSIDDQLKAAKDFSEEPTTLQSCINKYATIVLENFPEYTYRGIRNNILLFERNCGGKHACPITNHEHIERDRLLALICCDKLIVKCRSCIGSKVICEVDTTVDHTEL